MQKGVDRQQLMRVRKKVERMQKEQGLGALSNSSDSSNGSADDRTRKNNAKQNNNNSKVSSYKIKDLDMQSTQNPVYDETNQEFMLMQQDLNSIMPGDSVITSGTDSLFPKGLHIGTVTAVSMDAGSEGSYAVVTPSVDFRHIEEVFVLREVIESDSDEALPAVNTARATVGPATTPGPEATPTPSPTPAEETWSYPTAEATARILETLPEDEWVREVN